MIITPDKWKGELKVELNTFLDFLEKEGVINEDFDFYLERFFFVSAFIIRKLIESKKLSNTISNRKYKVLLFKKRDDKNYLNIESNYNIGATFPFNIIEEDFENQQYCDLALKDILNIIIHSSVLNTFNTNNYLYGILVTTEQRKDKLFFIKLEQMKSIVKSCITD